MATEWHIEGLAAIGSLVAANLTTSGRQVTFIKRSQASRAPVQLKTTENKVIALPDAKTLRQCAEINNLFVPLKAYDVLPFLTQCKDNLSHNASVILCHNGMGTIEQALSILPKSTNLYFCTTSHGAYKNGDTVVHAGIGHSFWKLIRQGNNERLSQSDFNALFDDCSESENLQNVLWQKLLINCAINPLTAIHNVKNGELAAAKYPEDIVQVVEEVCSVALCEGVQLDLKAMKTLVNEVISKTAKNTSSMLQDIQNNKTTEIDYINGYIVKLVQKPGLVVNKNNELYRPILVNTASRF